MAFPMPPQLPMFRLMPEIERHLALLTLDNEIQNEVTVKVPVKFPAKEKRKSRETEKIDIAPLFTLSAHKSLSNQLMAKTGIPLDTATNILPQYGLLGHQLLEDPLQFPSQENMIYTNISTPWSAFICGVQGSGKSHTLSCILENALISPSISGRVESPLAGLVLHYDRFTTFSSTQLCESVYLAGQHTAVRVLVSPTNYLAMKDAYSNLEGLDEDALGKLRIEPMYLPKQGLTISMMKSLMGLNKTGAQPLYMESIMKILRDMAISNQGRESFDYATFRQRVNAEPFLPGQRIPLEMRLRVLESFFKPDFKEKLGSAKTNSTSDHSHSWNFERGTLTIIDLSCPFVDSDDACALFNICISLFLKDRRQAGRIIALDEAHKFLNATSPEAIDLSETLLSIVRQQRHLGTRVIIATQEPTISPNLLDLCNIIIIHRFNSPAWFKAVKSHIAGAILDKKTADGKMGEDEIFRSIVCLATGEALVFCPMALFGRDGDENGDENGGLKGNSMVGGSGRVFQIGPRHFRMRTRKRITVDGGGSIMEK